MEDSIANRLRSLEDREEIRQLLMNYGRFLDKRDFVSFSQLFVEKDGEWIGGMGSAKSPEDIRKLMENTIGAAVGNTCNCHIFTNEIIDLQGDRADVTAKWMFIVQSDSGHPQVLLLGHYEDSLVRENRCWKFLRRTVYMDIPADAPNIDSENKKSRRR
jgi:hypothetical protein